MHGTAWLTAAAIVIAMMTYGCERDRGIPEPRVSSPEEKTSLPRINERVEREVEEGIRWPSTCSTNALGLTGIRFSH